MEQELWRKVEELFHAALERTPDARQTFLDGTCNGDIDLRRQVDLLLAKEKQAGSFLERPAIENMPVILTAAGSLLGQQFGPYQIVSPLGAGGMGEVYRAHDRKLDRDVAIKTLPHEFARDPERLSRLRREARTLASLNHPNIAAIYGLEESEEADCLVMELVEGEMLRGPLPVGTALDRACQVASALEAAHDKGIIHRDLKPANVKVTPQGRVKVLDFGLAKAIWWPEGNRDLSQLAAVKGVESVAGQIVGTPGYMSPEQARGRDVDKRTDIWAFGCLLYELLTGKRAFPGETLQDTIASVLEREPDWQALPAKTPTQVRELLRQCLQKDPPAGCTTSRTLAERSRKRSVDGTAGESPRLRQRRWRCLLLALPCGCVAPHTCPAARSGFSSRSFPILSPSRRFRRMAGCWRLFAVTPRSLGPARFTSRILPDGEPVQLTHDNSLKMSPTFSPDGSRIAYTTVDPQFHWDTWVVPTLGGEPQLLLRNASGLVWTGPRQVLFSEIKMGVHMGIVAAEESRIGARDVYLPEDRTGDGAPLLLVTRWKMGAAGRNGPGPQLVALPRGSDGRQFTGPACRTSRGRLHGGSMVATTANGCISLPIPAESITSGGSVFPMASRNRSLPGPPRRKASQWRQTAAPSSRRWRCRTPRSGFTTRRASVRFHWKATALTRSSHRMVKSCAT